MRLKKHFKTRVQLLPVHYGTRLTKWAGSSQSSSVGNKYWRLNLFFWFKRLGHRQTNDAVISYFAVSLLWKENLLWFGVLIFKSFTVLSKKKTKNLNFLQWKKAFVRPTKSCLTVWYLCSVHSCVNLGHTSGWPSTGSTPAAAVSQGDSNASDGNTRRQLTLLHQLRCVLPGAQSSFW